MVEEAAGTSMYESKRDQTNKLIEKKDAKLSEMDAVSEKFTNKIKSSGRWLIVEILVYHSSRYQFYQPRNYLIKIFQFVVGRVYEVVFDCSGNS